jgi:HlyD family secretion protein
MKLSIVSFLIIATVLISGCGNDKEPNTIIASGTIESVDVTVSSKVNGQIKKFIVDEGDRVKAGDLLLEIDHDLLDIQLRQAEAGIDQASAQLRLLQAGARKEDIKQAEELLRQAKLNLDQAETDRDRMRSLLETSTVTEKQFEDSQTRYELMLAQYKSAKENSDKIKKLTRPEEIDQAKANLKKAIAAADQLRKNISDCRVIAPVSGIISKKYVEEGENAIVNTSLLKISNLQTVDLMIYITETELGYVKLGQNADISVDAYKGKIYKGKVIFISPEAEFTPKNIQTQDERTKLVFGVKVEIPNPQFELKPGMPADAKIKF